MKKKVSELEEQLKDKNRSEKERDDSSTQNKKLQRKCEKLLDEVSHYQEIVTQLKAKLMETSEFKVTILNLCISVLFGCFNHFTDLKYLN